MDTNTQPDATELIRLADLTQSISEMGDTEGVRGPSGLRLIEDGGGQGRLIGHDVIVEVGSDS